jgi:hypothetical protein
MRFKNVLLEPRRTLIPEELASVPFGLVVAQVRVPDTEIYAKCH